MSDVNCPCKLTRKEILKLAELGVVHLGEGGVCNNKRKDGTPGDVCGMDLADHPTEGNKINSIPLFNNLVAINLIHTIIFYLLLLLLFLHYQASRNDEQIVKVNRFTRIFDFFKENEHRQAECRSY